MKAKDSYLTDTYLTMVSCVQKMKPLNMGALFVRHFGKP